MAADYTVSRSVQVAAPAAAVYERLVDLHRWRTWSPFEELDPGMARTYSGASSGVGAVYEWAGNMKAGAGRMEIVSADDASCVVVEQRNHKPFRSQSTSTFSLTGSAASTTVTWSACGPMTRMMRVMGVVKSMDGLLGPVFESGLQRLKAEAEAS